MAQVTHKVSMKQRIFALFGADTVLQTKHIKEFFRNEPVPQTDTYLLDACNYGNIGDLAITYAERKFLKKINLSCTPYQIGDFWPHARSLRAQTRKNAIICYQGGGNLTELYDSIDYGRCAELNYLSPSKCLIFPENISYSNTPRATAELNYVKKCFTKARVVLCARDHYSYNMMRSHFPQIKVILVPDIVLSLGDDPIFHHNHLRQRKVLFCLRNDVEKRGNLPLNEMSVSLRRSKFEIHHTDMVFKSQRPVTFEEGESRVARMAQDISSASLVVTDRLHGMIFSALCGTPCLAFPNNGRKVGDMYSTWLSSLKYIQFVNDPTAEDCASLATKLAQLGSFSFPTNYMTKQFKPLISELQNLRLSHLH